MNRSNYIDLDPLDLGRWRGQVKNAIRGKRGQAFLQELAEAMDAMPEKVLIADRLVNEDGDCCTIGVICKSRGIDVSKIDENDPEQVSNALGIARQLAAEIEYKNDEWCDLVMTPGVRWIVMRRWVENNIIKKKTIIKCDSFSGP